MQNSIPYHKERSVKGCVADAWRIFALGWRSYLRNTWPFLLLCGLGAAFAFEMLTQYVSLHLLPALRLWQTGGDPELIRFFLTPDIPAALYMVLAAAVCLISVYACAGRFLELIRAYGETDSLPRQMPPRLTRSDRRSGLRLLIADILTGFITLLLLSLVSLLAVKVTRWAALAAPLLIIYIWTTGNVVRLQYALNRQPLPQALLCGLRRSLGLPFIVQILTLIPAALLWFMGSLIPALYLLGNLANCDSLLRGDAAGMPTGLPVLFFLLNTLAFAFISLVSSWRTWALSMKL